MVLIEIKNAFSIEQNKTVDRYLGDVPLETSLEDFYHQLNSKGYSFAWLVRDTPDHRGRPLMKQSMIAVDEIQTVQVVADKPSNFDKKEINDDDTFIHFSNLKDGDSALEAKLGSMPVGGASTLIIDSGLEITFHRTLRMPDDDQLHELPQSLGVFPLYNVDAFSDRLPSHILERGGVFFPMWQREALWIQFRSISREKRYAIRVNLGRVNAISGLPINEDSKSQDYIIVPGQSWLDGIAVAEGVVRQFVAMPLGSGYTVEGQITGEEKYGGIQMEIIPSYHTGRWIYSYEDQEGIWKNLEEGKTPKDYQLVDGDQVIMKPRMPTKRPAQIRDFFKPDEIGEYIENLVLENQVFPESLMIGARPATTQYGGYLRESRETPSAAVEEHKVRPSYGPTVKEPIQEMGIAVGGRLIQDIYEDGYPRYIWNKSRTRLVNIQIFDSLTFEAVTHIVPPMTPITAQTYIDAGLPLFAIEEEVDRRLDGEENLKGVKSVSMMDEVVGIGSGSDAEINPSKPKKCEICGIRLCDCVVRPCNHQFCNICIKVLESQTQPKMTTSSSSSSAWCCPSCSTEITRVAGFSAPMNLPGEEAFKVDVPVVMLTIDDGRVAFESIARSRF